MAPVITVRGLVRAYGPREAVRGVHLGVHQGEVFAFLGPNGMDLLVLAGWGLGGLVIALRKFSWLPIAR